MTVFEQLIAIANRAKTIGGGEDYLLANAIFAWLLDQEFKNREDDTLCVVIETQDEAGHNDYESYYDIATIYHNGFEGACSLCIPAPLIGSSSLITTMKRATLVPREQHSRSFEEGGEDEMRSLMKEAINLAGIRNLNAARKMHLS
jgi:hypothetical protein